MEPVTFVMDDAPGVTAPATERTNRGMDTMVAHSSEQSTSCGRACQYQPGDRQALASDLVFEGDQVRTDRDECLSFHQPGGREEDERERLG